MRKFITTDHQAELNAAQVLIGWGYLDAVASPVGVDGGIDVRSCHALAQVKWRASKAGRPDLQRLYGARGSDTDKALFFFASAGYSREAVEYADQLGIGLFVYDVTGETTQVNKVTMPVMTGRSWVSTYWIGFFHRSQCVLAFLGIGMGKKSSRKYARRRRA